MSLVEVLHELEDEKQRLLESAGEVKDLYRSLAESIRTLTVPFRRSFTPDGVIAAALDVEAKTIRFGRHNLQSSEGEVQNNTSRLTELINNLYAIRNSYLSNPHFIELAEIGDIRRVHADIRQFLEELYISNSLWILQDPNSEASVLARQKRKDIEDLLKERIDPFFERLEQIKIDEYSLRIRQEIREEVGSLQNYNKRPEEYTVLIKERCSRLGLSYDPELVRAVVQDLEASDESLEKRIRVKYEERETRARTSTSSVRRKYMRVLYRYLARRKEVTGLLPILENIYFLYQPRPGLLEKIRSLFARLAGQERKVARKDIEYTFIVSRDSIERKSASLEALIQEANRLDKYMLRVKMAIRSARANKRIKAIPVDKLSSTIDTLRSALRRIFDDSFGLVQWLGKKSNQDRLAKLPEGVQRELNSYLDAIYATIIINAERLREIARRYPQAGSGGGEG